MEQETNIAQEEIFEKDLQLDIESRTYLREAAKWARFLGILGFVGSGCILLFVLIFWYGNHEILGALDGGTNRGLAALGMGAVAFIYIIIAVIGFFVALFTFRFGQRTYTALNTDSQINLRGGLSNLRFLFRMYGIFAIIYLSFIVLGILIGIVS